MFALLHLIYTTQESLGPPPHKFPQHEGTKWYTLYRGLRARLVPPTVPPSPRVINRRVLVSGVEKGRGSASTKNAAKEIAAAQALQKLGVPLPRYAAIDEGCPRVKLTSRNELIEVATTRLCGVELDLSHVLHKPIKLDLDIFAPRRWWGVSVTFLALDSAVMSQRAFPYIMAGLTGVFSGYYIFKPLLERDTASSKDTNGKNATSCDTNPQPTAVTTGGSACSPTDAHEPTNPASASQI
ncbi:hypothetical protein CERSUDRAFT_77253 [Gelatoporia subvermispora B]|uniref:DRBM domain-containing protein n=1 Tax=Ceriporiopsis subvermispora (strain B) TaxID=914234 RepID=M2R102_CERS8|nr:hypothetical protein CERSUDRAFT_77253 [Gelatoporia subvermispora B]